MTRSQLSRPDLSVSFLRCMWRVQETEACTPRTEAALRVIGGIFAEHTHLLRVTLAEHGWPGYRLVGEQGSKAAWQIATRCGDGVLQARALELLGRAVRQEDADPQHYALLDDRLCLYRNEPQRYGTHYIPTVSGDLKIYRVRDPQRLDDRRHALGLGPHAEYAQRLGVDVLPLDVTAASG
ncbi:DUF6624 domain-containing protein [Streptomyces sp. NPDC020707]|uniref:DUF6624 domain-containing protein n=1 Tax=Streptomyces sp. NPDC020707 TaxID=3365084 RepID=UPI003788A002